jgi:selenocysteine-specific elongation factor
MEDAALRTEIARAIRHGGARDAPDLVEALLDELIDRGELAREGATVRLATHRVELDPYAEEIERLVAAVAAGEPAPPSATELIASGFRRDVIDAAVRAGLLLRIAPEILLTPSFVERGAEVVRASGPAGITVSAFREALGTSRKYAVPLLEHMDERGLTRRVGDVRVARPSERYPSPSA